MKSIVYTTVPLENKRSMAGVLNPLGLMYVYAYAKEHIHGREHFFIDLRISECLEKIVSVEPEYVAISLMTPEVYRARELINYIRRKTSAKVVIGGAHPSLYPKEAFDQLQPDALFVGEAEEPFVQYINNQEAPNVLTKKTTEIRKYVFKNLDDLPFIQLDMDYHKYLAEPFEANYLPVIAYSTSRGCFWSKCTFCLRSGPYKRIFRKMSVDRVIDEVEHLYRLGIHDFVFYDDEFVFPKKWTLEFCSKILSRNLRIRFVTRAKADLIDDEVAEALSAAGCISLELGLESFVQKELDLINKNTTVQDNYRAVRILKRHGILSIGTFIISLPGSTPADAYETLNGALESDLDIAYFIPYHPFKNTPMYDQYIKGKANFIDPYLDAESLSPNRVIPKITYFSKEFKSIENLEKIRRDLYRRFYLRPSKVNLALKWSRYPAFRKVLKTSLFGLLKLINFIPQDPFL